MTDKPTIIALLAPEQEKQDYPLLSREIGRVLDEKPWVHDFKFIDCGPALPMQRFGECGKCGSDNENSECPLPYSWDEPLEVAAERLLRKVLGMPNWARKLVDAIQDFRGHLAIGGVWYTVGTTLVWFLEAAPAERCAVCLAALNVATIGDKDDG